MKTTGPPQYKVTSSLSYLIIVLVQVSCLSTSPVGPLCFLVKIGNVAQVDKYLNFELFVPHE